MVSTDVFVIGGGPAGLAAAIAARQRGLRVALADYSHPPIDKACGEGLMPGADLSLELLGVQLSGLAAREFRGIRFIGPEGSAAAEFPAGCGLALRRTLLHNLLVERARHAGVEMLWGARVWGLSEGAALLDGHAVRYQWLIGADGQNSQVRRWAGLAAGHEFSRRIGLRQHFAVAPWSEFVEVYWGDEAQMYVTPVSAEEVGIALLARKRVSSFQAELEKFASLARRLRGARASTRVKGALTVMRRLRCVCRGRVALAGDSSGSVDAITGDGLAISFQQAIALADALAAGDLRLYEAAHAKIAARPRLMGRLLLMMDAHPGLRRRALRTFARNPELLHRLLSAHLGEASVPGGMAHLGWELLTCR